MLVSYFINFFGIVETKRNPEEEAGADHLVEGVVTMMAMAEAADMAAGATVEAVGKFKLSNFHFSSIQDVVLFTYFLFACLAMVVVAADTVEVEDMTEVDTMIAGTSL